MRTIEEVIAERHQGDLISRSALKEDFESRLALCNEWIEKAKDKETKIRADATKHFICEVIMTIDNAPPIETTIEDLICTLSVEELKATTWFKVDTPDGEAISFRREKTGEPERPQGEWNYGEDEQGQDGWFCSECGFFIPWYYQYYEKDIDFIREYKACPHCIAEMITYTGKDRDKKGGDNNGNT